MRKQLTIEEFIKKAKKVHGDKYDYSLVEYNGNKIKVKIICPEHGEFEQIPAKHFSGQGCKRCSGLNKLTTEEFIKKANIIHGNKYNYSSANYINSRSLITIICPGHGPFQQKANGHLNGKGCKKCSGLENLTTEEFIKRAKTIHGDKYDYSLTVYENIRSKVKIICPEHGEFEQTAGNHLNGFSCQFCNESKGEKEIAKILLEKGIKFIPEHRFDDCRNKNPLPFDFYLPEYNTCIEYDGIQHFKPIEFFGGEEQLKQTQLHDNIKTQYCKENNIKLIRIRYNSKIEKHLNL